MDSYSRCQRLFQDERTTVRHSHSPTNQVGNYGIATGYRGRLDELLNLIRIITTLEYYRLGW